MYTLGVPLCIINAEQSKKKNTIEFFPNVFDHLLMENYPQSVFTPN